MKKRLFSLLLVTALCAGLLTVPAEATDLPTSIIVTSWHNLYYDQDDYEFRQTYGGKLSLSSLPPYIPQTFHDGLKLLSSGTQYQVKDGTYTPYNYSLYLTEDGRVVDLNRNRFEYMGNFSEGLAPFWVHGEKAEPWVEAYHDLAQSTFGNYIYGSFDFHYGYVNTEGVVVIPPIFGEFMCCVGTKANSEQFSSDEYHPLAMSPQVPSAAGKFIGGKAMIPGFFEQHYEDTVYTPSTFTPEVIRSYLPDDNFNDESWWDYFYRSGGVGGNIEIPGYIFIDKTGQWTGEYGIFDSYDDMMAGYSMYIYDQYGATPDLMFQDPVKFVRPDPVVDPVLLDGDPVDWTTVSEFDLGDYVPKVPQESTTPVPVTPEPTPQPNTTYGQAQAQFVGYTIDPDNLYSGRGDMVILLTNNTPNWDEGDLFHLMYSRFTQEVCENIWSPINSATEFLPDGYIDQIHYEIAPWEVKYLYIRTPYVINEAGKLLWRGFEDMDPHWMEISNRVETRTLFLQAETPAECDKLVWFFKRANGYPEMQLTYTPYNGVTLLAAPMPMLQSKTFLDQVLAPFTSQF